MQSQEFSTLSNNGIGAEATIRLGLPKGRMQGNLLRLLSDAGLRVSLEPRGYRASVSLPGFHDALAVPSLIALEEACVDSIESEIDRQLADLEGLAGHARAARQRLRNR